MATEDVSQRRHGSGCLPGTRADGPRKRARSRLSVAVDLVVSLSFIGGLLWLSFFYQLKVNVPPVPPDPFDRRTMYYSVVAPGPNIIWASGSYGRVIRSDDDGKTWKIQATNSNENLQVILSWNEREAVVAGDNGTILRTEDGGSHWTKIDAEIRPNGRLILNGLIVPNGGRALLIGEFGTVLASDDRGRTWRHTYPEEDVAWHGIATGPDGRLWVVGEFGHMARSEDGGASWRGVKSPSNTTLTSIAFTSGGEVVTVGLSGGAFRSTDAAASWRSVPLPSDENIFAVGTLREDALAFGGDGGVYLLKPSADHWVPQGVRDAVRGFIVASKSAEDRLVFAGSGLGEFRNGKWSFHSCPGRVRRAIYP